MRQQNRNSWTIKKREVQVRERKGNPDSFQQSKISRRKICTSKHVLWNWVPLILKTLEFWMKLLESLNLLLHLINYCLFLTVSKSKPEISDSPHRIIFVRQLKGEEILIQIGAPLNSLLQDIKLHYWLAESPGYWWKTFKCWNEDEEGLKSKHLLLILCILQSWQLQSTRYPNDTRRRYHRLRKWGISFPRTPEVTVIRMQS